MRVYVGDESFRDGWRSGSVTLECSANAKLERLFMTDAGARANISARPDAERVTALGSGHV